MGSVLELSRIERARTGIPDFDQMIDGGFPRGSLIVLSGPPGSGKTSFCTRFLYHGAADYHEPGVYVSLAEAKDFFMRNARALGFDLTEPERRKEFSFLDLMTVREQAVGDLLRFVLDEVNSIKAKRLVIDSYTALSTAFKEQIDARIVLHTVLNKITRALGCTSILITEAINGEPRAGGGMEEFVADGAISVSTAEFDGRVYRELKIAKLRATRTPTHKILFSLEKGFRIASSNRPKPFEPAKKFVALPDGESRFSTGSKALDQLLGGGLPRASYNVLEVDDKVPDDVIEFLLLPLECNFVANGNGVWVYPLASYSANMSVDALRPYLDQASLESKVKVVHFGKRIKRPYITTLRGVSFFEDYSAYSRESSWFRRKIKRPILEVIGYDKLENLHAKEITSVLAVIGEVAASVRELANVRINITRPSLRVSQKVASYADVYLKLVDLNGVYCLYGVRPFTGLHAISFDASEGHPNVELTPIL